MPLGTGLLGGARLDIVGFHLPIAVSAAGTFTAIQTFFWQLEKVQSRGNRQFVGRWLMRLTPPDANWSVIIVELFQRLFGAHHWTWRCFGASSLMTILTILAYTYIYWFIVDRGVPPVMYLLGPNGYETFIYLPLACLSDFITLWITRAMLSKAARSVHVMGITVFIIVNLVATIGLIDASVLITGLAIALASGQAAQIDGALPLLYGLRAALAEITFEVFVRGNVKFQLLYTTALITSVWLWAYLFVAQVIRLLTYVPPAIHCLSKVVDLKEHPVRSIGTVIAFLSAGFVWVVNLF